MRFLEVVVAVAPSARLARLAAIGHIGLAVMALLICNGARADIAGLPETDERVAVYRILEKNFIESPEGRRFFATLARTPCVLTNGRTPESLSQEGIGVYRGEMTKTYASNGACGVQIDTRCQSDVFLFRSAQDGRWTSTMSRIGFGLFVREIARRLRIPESVIDADLYRQDQLIIANIDRRLKRPVDLQHYQGHFGGMGIDNDMGQYGDSIDAIEYDLAVRWNEFRKSLDPGVQRGIPGFIYAPECGAGELGVTVELRPKNGTWRIISDFDFLLCEARNRDPWDPNRCVGWSQVVADQVELSGRYRYVAEWQDGRSKKALLNVDLNGGYGDGKKFYIEP